MLSRFISPHARRGMCVRKKANDNMFIFMTRDFWDEHRIPRELVHTKFVEYLGESNRTIDSTEEAISFVRVIIDHLQNKFVNQIRKEGSSLFISKLYNIFDWCFQTYMSEKNNRKELVKLNVAESAMNETLEENKSISLNIISSINLWLENALLFQSDTESFSDRKPDVENELIVDLYIYGLLSRALSYLSLSKNHANLDLFYGIEITPYENVPVNTLRYHPVIYFNPLLIGNQDVFSVSVDDYKNLNNSEFGKGFTKEYGLDLLLSLRIFKTIQVYVMKEGQQSIVVINKHSFLEIIQDYSKQEIDAEKFFDAFVLTEKQIKSQLKKDEPIVWRMNTNKYRHELRPFLCLNNDNLIISYQGLEQSIHIWLSYFANGGMIYSNAKDSLTTAIEKRNDELSKELVQIIRKKLNDHFIPGFDEIDVQYDRIFGPKECNYGDYDLIFYAKDENELFLIEAKYFSDSLSNSGVITDYEKLFKPNGYYEHCRKRYDLVLQNPDCIKRFIGVSGSLKVHFLFISSKPLEIEFEDKDGIVAFPCLKIFDKYLEGKLISEDGEKTIRPIHTL